MTSSEFTGERYIPGLGGAQIAYEHWHRYLFALRWARGKDVLDVAAGAGYGAEVLASVARRVWALDLDPGAIACARAKYRLTNLCFMLGSTESLPLPAHSIDLVVALEILEHLHEPERLIAETARVIRPGGVALISTPNKADYSDARNYSNPFHAREFYYDELRALLESYFRCVTILHQRMRAGSMISGDAGLSSEAPEILTLTLPESVGSPLPGMYFLAICSDQPVSPGFPSGSAYLDLTDMLFQESDLRLNQSMAGFSKLKQKSRELASAKAECDRQIERLQAEILGREQKSLRMQHEFREELARRDKTIHGLKVQLSGRTGQPESVRSDAGQE